MPSPLKPLADEKAAHNYLVWLLSAKDYPISDLKRKLKRRGLTEEQTLRALQKIQDQGLYNPQNYTRGRLRGLVRKGIAGGALKGKLRAKSVQVSDEAIVQAYEETLLTPHSQLDILWEKELRRGLPRGEELSKEERSKMKQKLLRKFVAKGHSFAAVQERLGRHGYR